jgi:DNA-binding MarR family transcriptional regulator/GNAT superfamily N-acetyltransferase
MERELVEQVRSFNRVVTQRIGALNEEYLASSRPLGASRVLWDLGDGADVRTIRERLDLDPGYLSRLLRRLESEELIRVRPAPEDHRVRNVELTRAGEAERDKLDRLSDELAASLLEPLNEPQRVQLIEAMATIERLLSAGMIEIRLEDSLSHVATYCLESYVEELDRRFDNGLIGEASVSSMARALQAPKGLFLVAFLRSQPVGCGGLRFHANYPAEIKRLWVAPAVRGLGVGRRILADLERRARGHGVRTVRLDTNRNLTEAIALYRRTGYQEIVAFNDEPNAHHWFEKHLARKTPTATTMVRSSKKKA